MSLHVYTAGPSGFSEEGRLWHRHVLLPALVAAGLEPVDPWAIDVTEVLTAQGMPLSVERLERLSAANRAMGRTNCELIDSSQAILANLNGTDVDSGTAAEIGYGFAVGKLVVGLRTDFRLAADNDGSLVNLQVEYFIVASGGIVARSLDEAIAAVLAAS